MTAQKLLIRFALKYPWLIVWSVILGSSGALFNGISTALIVPLLLSFLGQDQGFVNQGPPILRRTMSVFEQLPGDWQFLAMIGAVVGAIVLKNVAMYSATLVSTYLARRLVNGMRLEALDLLLKLDLDYFSKQKIGNIINSVNHEIGRTSTAIRIGITMFTTIMTILVFIWLLLMLSWQLTIAATALLAMMLLVNQWFVRRAKQYGQVLSERSKDYSTKLLEILTGIRLIKTVSGENTEYQNIAYFIREREKAEYNSQSNYAAIAPINEVSGIITILGIIIIGRYLFSDQITALSTILLTYLAVLFRLLPMVSKLNGERSKFANVAPSAEITADFLRLDNKPIMAEGEERFSGLRDALQFEQVSFAYPGHQDWVLQDITLRVPRGKTTALVGASGAGKSTLVDLVPRFYDPTQGRITVDGRDLREFTIASLRQEMGVVSQDTFLFNNTVRYNVTYGLQQVADAQLQDAIERANAHEFIAQLPQGLETEVGDRGVMLSGGQRQRLAIARALLRDPSILILDEATSALDTVSERLVQQAIDELCRDRTTLVIAHRLSTIQQADQIVVLECGRIVEVGTHAELLAKADGTYAKLHTMQFGKTLHHPATPNITTVLPTNAALLRASLRASQELRTHLSFEVRSGLNRLFGILQLLTDSSLVESPEERHEIVEEAYEALQTLLKTISFYEERGSRLPLEKLNLGTTHPLFRKRNANLE